MKFLVLAAVLAVASHGAMAADAPKAVCIDASKSYAARPLNSHDVFVQQTIGKPKPPVRLTTSCVHLDPAIGIRVSSQFNCVGLGDRVAATTLGSGRQSCIVTRVAPYVPEDSDINK